jgi:competence protein ComEC
MFFFMALCGFTPSVLRAGLMYGVFLLSRIFLQKGDGLNSLSIAVTIMLILNPYLIWDVGFLLSAASTFGIIVILPIIEGYIDKFVKFKWLNWLLKLSAITVSALITTVPISVYYFGEISTVAVFTNIAISFAVTVLLILVVIGIALHLISGSNFLVSMLFTASSVISSYIIFVIKFFSSLPFAAIPCKMWAIMLIYILILAIFIILKYTYIIRKEKRSV